MTTYYITRDDTVRVAKVHIPDCVSRKGAGEECDSFEEAIGKGWGDDSRCVRWCADCALKIGGDASRICLCPSK